MALQFALNHMTVARQNYTDAFDLAAMLGCIGVEFRNDLPSELFDGDAPDLVKARAKASGQRILGLSEIKMFNAWDDRKASEAEDLLTIAKAIGSETISLIPRCDGHGCGNGERQANLRLALREVLPMLESFGIVGLVEPLGFEHSSLRYKSEAMEAIASLGGDGQLKLVHDTFHHYLAGETEFFPSNTGIVHVSGVEDQDLALHEIGDEHRVLVGPKDRLGNIKQLRDLIAAGFDGPVSYEAFSPIVHSFAKPKEELQASMRHLDSAVSAETSLIPG
ncbi:MAG: TIM barrel protein [Pseudomonadota bacterium]